MTHRFGLELGDGPHIVVDNPVILALRNRATGLILLRDSHTRKSDPRRDDHIRRAFALEISTGMRCSGAAFS
jgi:hypothetical protein